MKDNVFTATSSFWFIVKLYIKKAKVGYKIDSVDVSSAVHEIARKKLQKNLVMWQIT